MRERIVLVLVPALGLAAVDVIVKAAVPTAAWARPRAPARPRLLAQTR